MPTKEEIVLDFLKRNKKYGFQAEQIAEETGVIKETVYNVISDNKHVIEKERIYSTPKTKDVFGLYYLSKEIK